ncbi:MAG: hypothetical protein KF874_05940 [Rhizobiaceae bacterium]|nr:hypothetical protein [Rhizobiaceae bacterium]
MSVMDYIKKGVDYLSGSKGSIETFTGKIGDVVTGALGGDNMADLFKLDVKDGQTLNFSLENLAKAGDVIVKLYNKWGQELPTTTVTNTATGQEVSSGGFFDSLSKYAGYAIDAGQTAQQLAKIFQPSAGAKKATTQTETLQFKSDGDGEVYALVTDKDGFTPGNQGYKVAINDVTTPAPAGANATPTVAARTAATPLNNNVLPSNAAPRYVVPQNSMVYQGSQPAFYQPTMQPYYTNVYQQAPMGYTPYGQPAFASSVYFG